MMQGSEPTWVGVMLILGAVLLIAVAFVVGMRLFKARYRPPRSVDTVGPSGQPPVSSEQEPGLAASAPSKRHHLQQ